MLALLCFGPSLALVNAAATDLATAASAAVVVPDTQQFDFWSSVNGRPYRLLVSTPPNFDPAKTYPVLHVLDANYYFAAARSSL